MNSHRGNSRFVHPTVANELAATVSLHLGKPAECCLKFDRGLRRDTTRGPRVLFTMTDDRKLWVDPPVADRIEATVRPGEPFWICKRKAPGNSQREVYDIWTGGRDRGLDPEPAPPAQDWENSFSDNYTPGPTERRLDRDASEEMRLMARTIDAENARKAAARNGRPVPPRPQAAPPAQLPPPAIDAGEDGRTAHPAWAVITDRTKDAIDALAAIRKHAEQYGRLIEPEDARSLLCTIIIGRQQRGGR